MFGVAASMVGESSDLLLRPQIVIVNLPTTQKNTVYERQKFSALKDKQTKINHVHLSRSFHFNFIVMMGVLQFTFAKS